MLDLESDDPRSPHAELPASDELQTVERVLPGQRGAADIAQVDQLPTTPHYIQAVRSKAGIFLRTNLPHTETARTTATGIAWLIGRSRNCAIVFPDPAVSRCHAVVGYDAQYGFYIMDVGSSNGTFLNQQRLVTMQRYPLNAGHIITISHISVEIFLLDQET